ESLYEQQLQNYINYIIYGLQQVQLKAKQNIKVAQEKQKEYYNESIKKKQFYIGDKVLLYQSAQAKVH
ncbi:2150_t:CDS:1, partial [Scutellospora calospora]